MYLKTGVFKQSKTKGISEEKGDRMLEMWQKGDYIFFVYRKERKACLCVLCAFGG
ncbi:MAG: hypothetical protein ACO2PO_09930 [Candidatus Calescibacterium sp.]